MAEEKEKKRASLYDKKPAEHSEKSAEPKKPDYEKTAGKHSSQTDIHSKHMKEREALHKTHEGERKDLHGNHREEHRKMHIRHEKAISDLNARQDAELQAQPAPEAAGAANAAPAPAAGTPGEV